MKRDTAVVSGVLSTMQTTLSEYAATARDVDAAVDDAQQFGEPVMYAFIAMVFLLVVLLAAAVGAGKRALLTAAVAASFCMLVVYWLGFGALLASSVAIADACVYAQQHESDWRPVVGVDVGRVLNACYGGDDLVRHVWRLEDALYALRGERVFLSVFVVCFCCLFLLFVFVVCFCCLFYCF
jgi:hypothetical protein